MDKIVMKIWNYDCEGNRIVQRSIDFSKSGLDACLDYRDIRIPTCEEDGLTIEVDGVVYDDWEF